MIDPQAVALRISIGEQAPLQHLVRRIADARHDVGRRKRRLFDFGEDGFSGFRLSSKYPTFDQRKVTLWPDLGQVEGLKGKAFASHASVITWMNRVHAREIAGLDNFRTDRADGIRGPCRREPRLPRPVRLWMPCWVRKWNLTQMRSFAALRKL